MAGLRVPIRDRGVLRLRQCRRVGRRTWPSIGRGFDRRGAAHAPRPGALSSMSARMWSIWTISSAIKASARSPCICLNATAVFLFSQATSESYWRRDGSPHCQRVAMSLNCRGSCPIPSSASAASIMWSATSSWVCLGTMPEAAPSTNACMSETIRSTSITIRYPHRTRCPSATERPLHDPCARRVPV